MQQWAYSYMGWQYLSTFRYQRRILSNHCWLRQWECNVHHNVSHMGKFCRLRSFRAVPNALCGAPKALPYKLWRINHASQQAQSSLGVWYTTSIVVSHAATRCFATSAEVDATTIKGAWVVTVQAGANERFYRGQDGIVTDDVEYWEPVYNALCEHNGIQHP